MRVTAWSYWARTPMEHASLLERVWGERRGVAAARREPFALRKRRAGCGQEGR